MRDSSRFVYAVMVAGAIISHTPEALAQASATTGGIRGVIHSIGGIAAGATIVATSPALQGEQLAIADDDGQYFLPSLPPGSYTLTAYAGGTTTRAEVVVHVGGEAVVDLTIIPTTLGAEVIPAHVRTPIIDQGSTKTGVTIASDFTLNVPTGRTFGDVLGVAPGAQADFYGTSIGGATSPENTYVVEGINTTDTGFGALATNLPNEFVLETEVITGGYGAEFGRATGGLVHVVTKQGSNEFHGSVFAHYTPGQLAATAKTIQREGGSIDTHTDLDYAYDVGAELGGPIIRDKLWFHVGFDPSTSHGVTARLVRSQVDRNQDGIPDVDPSTGLTLHEAVANSTVPQYRNTYFFTAKLDGAIDDNNRFQVSAFGNPSRGTANDFGSATTYAPGDNVFTQNSGAYDVAAKYTSKLDGGTTQLDAVVGFHRGYTNQSPRNELGGRAIVVYDYERSLHDFADLEGSAIAPAVDAANPNTCNDRDPNDPYPRIRNCPVSRYAEQGLGNLEHRTNDRTSAIVTATRRVKAAGYHTLKAGADLELSTYDSTARFTGGASFSRGCNTDPATGLPAADCDDPTARPGRWEVERYATVAPMLPPGSSPRPAPSADQICLGGLAICSDSDRVDTDTSNTSFGAFVQDSWQPRPDLTLDAGVRLERQSVGTATQVAGRPRFTGEPVPATAFTLDNWAPRLGVRYDPTSDGRSKLFAHWGRYDENIPMDLNVRQLAGTVEATSNLDQHQRRPGEPGYNPACDVNHTAGVDPSVVLRGCTDGQVAGFSGGDIANVAPDLRGQHVDELVIGGAYEPHPDLELGITYTHRTIGDVIEDVSTDGGSTFVIANPGRDYSDEVAALQAQAMAARASNPALSQDLARRANQLASVGRFDPPSRNYDALTLRAEHRPTNRSLLIASYTYSALRGNYAGLFSTETNQLDPNITSQYDLPDLLANRYGPLGLDRPHSVKLDGFYQLDLSRADALVVGASIRAQSGIVHNALGAHPTYGPGEAYLLPRGSIARSPLGSTTDLQLAYRRRLARQTFLEGFVRVFNLFDQQSELNVDENYTFDSAQPIVGGDLEDLRHAKAVANGTTTVNRTLLPNKNFDHTSLRSPPRSFELGLRLSF